MPFNDFSEEYLNTVLDDGLTIREHMEQGYKKATEYYKKSCNPKFHRTFDEQNASFEFLEKYRKKIKYLENKIYWPNNTIKYNEDNKFSVILALFKCNKSIFYYNKLKKFCYKNNGQIYFQDMWEYCHNSRCECFEFISQTKDFKLQLINILKIKNG